MTLSNAHPKPLPRALEKLQHRAEEKRALRAVWAEVDKRDGYSCRVCGKFCNPRAITLLEKIHRHHLEYRSHGGMDTRENLVSLCAGCHGLVHAGEIRLSGNADTRNTQGNLSGVRVERMRHYRWELWRFC